MAGYSDVNKNKTTVTIPKNMTCSGLATIDDVFSFADQ